MYILFTSIFFAKLIIFFRNEQKMSKKISATTESNTDFLFCLLNGNFLDAAITIYHDIHIAAICHLVNTCRVILYDVSKVFPDVSICQIFKEGELDEKVVVRKFRQTTQHGAMAGKNQSKEVKFYNLDVIISVGYRVKSIQGTRFRQWATERLNEYIVKGFTMDDERLKNLGGGNYWKELLDRSPAKDIFSFTRMYFKDKIQSV